MKSIYFGDKVINFAADAPAGAALLPDPPRSIAKVLQNLEITKSVWVVSPLWQKLFDDFSSLFDVRRAAGGVVADPSGNVLMILRHGRWDLPKGHIERGESARQCAEREVMEECGVEANAGKMICTTCHTYMLDGCLVLKSCDWFAMSCPREQRPVPQREEGIECASWIPRGELGLRLESSYPTVKSIVKTYFDEK